MSLISDDTKLSDAQLKRIFISHDPDSRRIDSERLLHCIESILFCDISSHSSVLKVKCLSEFELIAGLEPIGHIISKASHQINCASSKDCDVNPRVMTLFDLLGNYTWDAKMVLVLTAFAITYGELLLVNQLYCKSPLAALVSDLRQTPNNSTELWRRLKSIRSLFNILTDLTKSIIMFCTLPVKDILLDDEIVSQVNHQVYTVTFWVIKATLICSSRITYLVSSKSDLANEPTAAIWELTSLARKLSIMSNNVKHNVETCQQQIELKLCHKLRNLRNEVYEDNQEMLRILLGTHSEFPLKDCASKTKPKKLSELKNKVVLLLISTPNLQADTFFLLADKLYSHSKTNVGYELVWVPIIKNSRWSETDKRSFEVISNTFPWLSIRRPWHLNSAAVEYITERWNFNDQPVMPVLDTNCSVVNSDGLSMALVWGTVAFPFSDTREFELWKDAEWTVEFLVNNLDPLVSAWIEEGRNLCIFGGNNAEWIEQFSSKVKSMIDGGLKVKVIYAGQKNLYKMVKNIFQTSGSKTLFSASLPVMRLEFFWLRVENLRKSKLRTRGTKSNDDMIMQQLEKLLDLKCGKDGWSIYGMPKDAIKILQGKEVMEFFTRVSFQGNEVSTRAEVVSSPETGPCGHFKAVAYSEELVGQEIKCDRCRKTMELFFISE